MDITLGIICFRLLWHYKLRTSLSTEQDYPIRSFRIWQGELPEDSVLYLINPDAPSSASIPEKYWKGKSRIFFCSADDMEQQLRKNLGNLILLQTHSCESNNKMFAALQMSPLFSLINILQDIFQEFNGWYGRTQLLCQQKRDFTEILNELEQTWRNQTEAAYSRLGAGTSVSGICFPVYREIQCYCHQTILSDYAGTSFCQLLRPD